jgi:LIM domain
LGELTPTSSRSSSMASPRSASSDQKSPWRIFPRKVSAPPIRRPPSPELTNLDCAFPPFPTSSLAQSKTPVQDKKSRKTKPGNEYNRIHGGTYNQSAASTSGSSTFGEGSTRKKRTGSIHSSRQRDESGSTTIGFSQPPSINVSRRPSFNSAPVTRKGSNDDAPPLPTLLPRTEDPESTPSTAGDDNPVMDHPQLELHTTMTAELKSKPVPNASKTEPISNETSIRQAKVELHDKRTADLLLKKQPSYRAKRPPPIDSGRTLPILQRFKSILSPRPRAPTFPLHESDSKSGVADRMARRPSDPLNGSSINQTIIPMDEREHALIMQSPEEISSVPSTANVDSLQEFSFDVPQTELKSNISSPSQIGQESYNYTPVAAEETQEVAIPPDNIPTVVEAVFTEISEPSIEYALRTFRTSVDSATSKYSDDSSLRSISSKSSLQLRDEMTRTQSNTTWSAENSKFQSLDIQSTGPTRSLEENGVKRRTRSSDTNAAAEAPKPALSDSPPLVAPRISELQPDSPTDPLFQNGRLSPIPAVKSRHAASESRKASQSSHLVGPSHSKSLLPNKGTCRGCQTLIMATQKSVSSADGRLTGRYHKECFLCKTCKKSFATADFYVLDDHPYCAQHYHELNETICGSCGNGIEGQYLETSAVGSQPSKKFHASCLACTTCRVPLREDYFEFNGRVYCEKDAFRLASLPSRSQYDSAPARPSPLVRELVSSNGGEDLLGGRFPERRITKLIETTT